MKRQQLRWVASAAALAVVGAAIALDGLAVEATAVVTWGISLSFAMLPLAIGAAILRYRLYDLDHIISRTLAVAAAFQPVRRRIQAVVDRRFNRRRHDTAQTIDAFSTRSGTSSAWAP